MWNPELEFDAPAERENVALVRQAVQGLVEPLELEEDRLADLVLAVSEACANVVLHAYEGEPGRLAVVAGFDEDDLVVAVRDEGRGLTPIPRADGLGVGLSLIASLADRLEVTSGEGPTTEVLMRFRVAG